MSEVTFFGEVTGLTSRAVDDSDEEDEVNAVTSLEVAVVFQPSELIPGPRVRMFVSLVDHLPSGLNMTSEITTDTSSGFTAELIQLPDQQMWLAGRFSSPLLTDSWQTVALVDSVMQKLRPQISDALILLVDRSVTLQKICTDPAPTGSDFGAKSASVPKTVSSPFEAAAFEWCVVHNFPAQILLVPGPESVTSIPQPVFDSLRGLRLPAVSDSNMFT